MAIRVLPDGSFSCDTPAEALAMRDLLIDRRVRDSRREARRTARHTAVVAGTLAGTGPEGGPSANPTATMINTLTASPQGVSSDELAQSLGVTARSLPPLMVALRRTARAAGHELDSLLVREREYNSEGRPISRYRLTAKGIEAAEEMKAANDTARRKKAM